MAIVFRSYWQPLLVFIAIPFGFAGIILGHLLMHQTLSVMSMLGFLACAGVVVNDNIVLLYRIRQCLSQEKTLCSAVTQAGHDRLRAIVLISLTTFIGLLPIMFETSVQAQFLIPLVTSLAFGVLFSTVVTLFLVPAIYMLRECIKTKGLQITENATSN